MKTTLKQILKEHLAHSSNWVTKGELGMIAEREGYLPESVGRLLRIMAELGEIKVSYYQGKRKQQLSRYAHNDVEEPIKIINKPTIVEREDGSRVAVFN